MKRRLHVFDRVKKVVYKSNPTLKKKFFDLWPIYWNMVETIMVVPKKTFLSQELTTLKLSKEKAWLPSL